MKSYPSYSVTIRTLGTSGDKYSATLSSIKAQKIQPEEVIVVIPEDYELPVERMGNERFVFSKKGMVVQRCVGFDEIKSEYTLALDDDVSFAPDLVEKLFDIALENEADFVNPRIIDNNALRRCNKLIDSNLGGVSNVLSRIFSWSMGIHWQSADNDGYSVRIAATGGFITKLDMNESENYPTQSGQGACIFGRTTSLKKLDFNSERWLEEAGYALPDDQVMFYKLFIQGNKLLYAPSVYLNHLDAGTSITTDKKLKNIYASARNGIIFWHRFIYSCGKGRATSIFAI